MNVYEEALQVQDACNLSGVAHALSRALTVVIWPEVREQGGGTEQVNTHPAVVLYVAQLVFLSTGGCIDFDKYSAAYQTCKEQTHEEDPMPRQPA